MLPGMSAVARQLDDVVAVLQAEQQRRCAGLVVKRPTWKNLVFAGGPGTGKSRAAAAVSRLYRELGVLSRGRVEEFAAGDIVGATVSECNALMAEAFKHATGDVLLISDAHSWLNLPDHGQHVLRRLYGNLTESRELMSDEVAVILTGEPQPLRELLRQSPALAARFRAFVAFPGYSAEELADIFGALATDAGLTPTPAAAVKATAVLAQAESGHGRGSARLAVRLIDQVITAQARRMMHTPWPLDTAALSSVTEADIPEEIISDAQSARVDAPGQYL